MLFQQIWEVFSTSEYITLVLEGFRTTLIIAVGASLLGLVLGTIVAVVKIAAQKGGRGMIIPNIICDVYLTIIRGTPVALQLFIMAFAILAIRGFPLKLTAILTFGINSGAYVAESLRGGIQSVDAGQTEAARSLGLGEGQAMLHIVIPQAIKNVIPAIGNELIALLKETSIVSMVGIIDLTFSARISRRALLSCRRIFARADYPHHRKEVQTERAAYRRKKDGKVPSSHGEAAPCNRCALRKDRGAEGGMTWAIRAIL